MAVIKYIDRLKRIDSLIYHKATGTPKEFAYKLGIRRSTLFQTLQEMRILGADIKYSSILQTYYYADNRRLVIYIQNSVPQKPVFEGVT